jgi:hypothetical protein
MDVWYWRCIHVDMLISIYQLTIVSRVAPRTGSKGYADHHNTTTYRALDPLMTLLAHSVSGEFRSAFAPLASRMWSTSTELDDTTAAKARVARCARVNPEPVWRMHVQGILQS